MYRISVTTPPHWIVKQLSGDTTQLQWLVEEEAHPLTPTVSYTIIGKTAFAVTIRPTVTGAAALIHSQRVG